MDIRWQPHVLSVLADLRSDAQGRPVLHKLADTLVEIETQLDVKDGAGHMWIVPITGAGWVIVCSNDAPGVLVVRYLGPSFG